MKSPYNPEVERIATELWLDLWKELEPVCREKLGKAGAEIVMHLTKPVFISAYCSGCEDTIAAFKQQTRHATRTQ